jgi:anti-anti-sigma factor
MTIQEEKREDVLIVAPIGRVDSTTSLELERYLLGRLASGPQRVVIDMLGVEYISSAGLRVLLMLAKKLGPGSGRLVLCSMGAPVRQVFELAGFIPLFAVEASRELALARLGAGR